MVEKDRIETIFIFCTQTAAIWKKVIYFSLILIKKKFSPCASPHLWKESRALEL